MSFSKDGAFTKCMLLPEKLSDSGDFCCMATSNDWSALDKNSYLKTMNDFNHVN